MRYNVLTKWGFHLLLFSVVLLGFIDTRPGFENTLRSHPFGLLKEAEWEWPLVGKDSKRRAATSGLISPPLQQKWEWRYPERDMYNTCCQWVVAGKDKLFVTTVSADATKSLAALDIQTGAVLWYQERVRGRSFERIAYDPLYDRVYAGTLQDIVAFNPDDGAEIMRIPIPDTFGYLSGLTIVDGYLYVATCREISKIDKDGNFLWTYRDRRPCGYGEPAVGNGKVYVGQTLSWTLDAFDANMGQPLWTAPTPGRIYPPPVIGDGLVFAGCQGQPGTPTVIAYDASTGQVKWGVYTGFGGTVDSPMSYLDGILYFGSYDQNVYAVDTTVPRILWTYTTPDDIRAAVVRVGDIVYTVSAGKLWALDAANGTPVWHLNIEAPTTFHDVVPYHGTLFVSAFSQAVYAFYPTSGPDFRMSLKPNYLSLGVDERAELYVSFHTTYKFTDTLQLTVSSLPNGVSADIAPIQVQPSEIATVTINISPAVDVFGPITLIITATADLYGIEHTALANIFLAKARVFLPLIIR